MLELRDLVRGALSMPRVARVTRGSPRSYAAPTGSAVRRWRLPRNGRFVTWCFAVMLLPLVGLALATTVSFAFQLATNLAHPEFGSVRGLMVLSLTFPVMLLLLRGTLRELWPQRVCVGPDGVEIRSLLTRALRIPIDAIAEVEVGYAFPYLRIVEATGVSTTIVARDATQLREIAATIRRRQAAASDAPAPMLALSRGDAGPQAWRRRIERLVDTPTDYRSLALEPSALWRIVEHPTAAPEQRVGAALALHEIALRTDGARATEAGPLRDRDDVARRARFAVDEAVFPDVRTAVVRAAARGELDEEALARAEAEMAAHAVAKR
ncbi:MAG: hypothetical protein AAGN82_14770 [Myxococcota bacterium]